MTKDSQGAGARSHVSSRKAGKVYQRVTGNEGPSPFMKLYLKLRQKGKSERSAEDGMEKKR